MKKYILGILFLGTLCTSVHPSDISNSPEEHSFISNSLGVATGLAAIGIALVEYRFGNNLVVNSNISREPNICLDGLVSILGAYLILDGVQLGIYGIKRLGQSLDSLAHSVTSRSSQKSDNEK